jgi:hypothetical protein
MAGALGPLAHRSRNRDVQTKHSRCWFGGVQKGDGAGIERHYKTPVNSTMQRHVAVYFNFTIVTLHFPRHLPDSLTVHRRDRPS